MTSPPRMFPLPSFGWPSAAQQLGKTMEKRVIDQLNLEQPSAFHAQLLADSMAFVAESRKKMGEYYSQWDTNLETYSLQRRTDSSDVKAAERGEPIKMVVPLSYSQVQTFVSFCFGLFTQRERLFELIPVGPEFVKPAKVGEAFLHRDLVKSVWEARLYQYLLDVAIYGVGILKIRWCKEYESRLTPVPQSDGTVVHQQMRVPSFTGNKVTNISPYQFFPDPSLPLSRFQEGRFVATEEVMTRNELISLEQDGQVSGIKWVPGIDKNMLDKRGDSRVYGVGRLPGSGTGVPTPGEDTANVIVTEIQRTLVPATTILDDKPLGPETYPIKYVIWVANDARIIKCEPMNYVHGRYTYELGEYNPNVLSFSNPGLAASIHLLQDTFSWFINSRVTNVRKILSGQAVVDPTAVEVTDITERRPLIRLKPNVPKIGVEKYYKPLETADVTASHVQDAGYIQQITQQVTGINETLMGEIYPGRRSATENRNATQSAAGRVKMIAMLLYRNGLEPMGRQMLSNLRDGLDENQVVRLVGAEDAIGAQGLFVRANKLDLVGEYDFEMFDGTLPSERVMNAQALGETMMAFITNPPAAIALGIDPRAIWLEYLELRGIRHPRRFLLPYTPSQTDPNGLATPQTSGPLGSGPSPGVPGFDPQSLLSGVGNEGYPGA